MQQGDNPMAGEILIMKYFARPIPDTVSRKVNRMVFAFADSYLQMRYFHRGTVLE
jgi:hypothetical protein